MPRTPPIGLRLEKTDRDTLEEAALQDDRPVASMAAKIVKDWAAARRALRRASENDA